MHGRQLLGANGDAGPHRLGRPDGGLSEVLRTVRMAFIGIVVASVHLPEILTDVRRSDQGASAAGEGPLRQPVQAQEFRQPDIVKQGDRP